MSAISGPYGAADVAAADQAIVTFDQCGVSVVEGGTFRAAWSMPGQEGFPDLQGACNVGRVAIRPDGTLIAVSGTCSVSAIMAVAPPWQGSRGRLISVADQPYLEGPLYPIHLAAGKQVVIQSGHMWRPNAPLWRGKGDWARVANPVGQFEGIQRWDLEGHLLDQWTQCAYSDRANVATDADDTYFFYSGSVTSRPDNGPPQWVQRCPGLQGMRIVAGDAGGDAVVALDEGTRSVLVFGRSSPGCHAWSWSQLDRASIPVDIATDGTVAYVADVGRQRVALVDLANGLLVQELALHDPPRAIDLGPSGELYVLGVGGWVMRYTRAGDLTALWSLPQSRLRDAVDPTDIAVGDDGRVYVSYVGLVPDTAGQAPLIASSGVWVFAPVASPPATPAVPPPVGACLLSADKTASPSQLWLGETTSLTLRIEGQCPGHAGPHQVMIVLDTSRSMAWSYSLWRGTRTLVALLETLDPSVGQAGLVTFSDSGALSAPLSDEIAALRSRVLTVRAIGDTHLGLGIDLAREELTGRRRNAAAHQSIVVVTDGQYHDDPAAAVTAATAAGISLLVLVYPSDVDEKVLRPDLARLFGPDVPLYFDLRTDQVKTVADPLRAWTATEGLLDDADVYDEIPPNMQLVSGSVDPPAALAGPALQWALGPVTGSVGVTLTYRLEPLESGTWPTNVQANATYRDALGHDGRIVFPIPIIEVAIPPTPTPTATPTHRDAYLPIALRESRYSMRCPVDVVLAIDTSTSMAGAKLDSAKSAAEAFVDLVDVSRSQIALVAFEESGRVVQPLTTDVAALRAAIEALETHIGSRLDLGILTAQGLLSARGSDSERDPVIIVITDGLQVGDPDDAVRAAERSRRLGTPVYAFGIGEDAAAAFLAAVVKVPGRAYMSPTQADLETVYRQIAPLRPCQPEDLWSRRCP